MIARTPARAASSTPSGNGKNASEANTAPAGSWPCWRALWTARNEASTRDICPAPMPIAASRLASRIAFDLTVPTAAQANRRSGHSASVGSGRPASRPPGGGGDGVERRHAALSHRGGMARPAVRLGGRRDGQVERDPARQARGCDRHRRWADVAGGRLVSRGPQGAPARPRSGRGGVSFRRVLSVLRRGRRGSPRRGARDHPVRRVRQGLRGDRGRRSAQPRDGDDGRPAIPALTDMTSMRDQLTPYCDAERPPYVPALVVACGALILYVVTLAPTTQFWDASEYITAVHALGIPHPPGNPLFILLAHAWGLLPLSADYAQRINLLAAATSAAAAGLWFLIAERWLRPIVSPTWPRRLTAAAGVMVSATAFTVWNQSVVNEKVYTVSVFSIALVLWLAVRWADQPAAARRDHQLVLIVYLLALTATNHLMGVLAAPDPRALLRPRFLIAAALVAAVGTSVDLFIPIRAHFDPYLNEGEPTTWQALQAVLARAQFGKPSVF